MTNITDIKQETEEWLAARKGVVTGTKARAMQDKRGGKKRVGFYEYIAERLSTDTDEPEDENAKARGKRLEPDALDAVEDELDVALKRNVFLLNEHDKRVGLSPDGVIDTTEMVETKCLATKRHVKVIYENAWKEKELKDIVRNKHYSQAIHYFVANEKLDTLYWASFDPRFPVKPLHVIAVNRDDVVDDIRQATHQNAENLQEAEAFIDWLTF